MIVVSEEYEYKYKSLLIYWNKSNMGANGWRILKLMIYIIFSRCQQL